MSDRGHFWCVLSQILTLETSDILLQTWICTQVAAQNNGCQQPLKNSQSGQVLEEAEPFLVE